MTIALTLAPDAEEQLYRDLAIEDPATGRLIHTTFSRAIGNTQGNRDWLWGLQYGFAKLATFEFRLSDGTLEPAPVPEYPQSGWRTSKTAMRALGLNPTIISGTWTRTAATDGVHARLPLELVRGFLPDEAWRVAAFLIARGPIATQDRLERVARLEALRPIKPTRARPNGGNVSAGTIEVLLKAVRRIMRELMFLSNHGYPHPALASWQALPDWIEATKLGALEAETDRTAPPLMVVRTTLRRTQAEIEHRRKFGSPYLKRLLRKRLLIALLAVTGARISALSRVKVCDYEARHRFPDGDVGPAVRLFPGKSLSPETARWKALPEEVAHWLDETITYFALQRDDTIWSSDKRRGGMNSNSLACMLTGTADMAPGLPREDAPSIGYSAHSLRHLAAQLASSVGHDYLEDNPDAKKHVTPEVFREALLDHDLSSDHLGYLDLKTTEGRERWARRAGLGLWEYVWGDRGARHAPDRERIERAVARRDEIRAEQAAVEVRIAELRLQRKAIEARGQEAEAMPAEEVVPLAFRLLALTGALDDEQEEAKKVQTRFFDAERELRDAQTTLVPLPDDAPDPGTIEIVLDSPTEDESVEPVREWLTVGEAARAFGVSEPTMRRWFRGETPHHEGDPRNAWQPSQIGEVIETHSTRKRRLVVSRLDRSRIAPEVMRAINQMLLNPPR
jgi:integrase